MKSLYCVENGYMGYAQVRLYVWADSKERALEMAKETYKSHAKERGHTEGYWKDLSVEHLFDRSGQEFCTEPSDNGFLQ